MRDKLPTYVVRAMFLLIVVPTLVWALWVTAK